VTGAAGASPTSPAQSQDRQERDRETSTFLTGVDAGGGEDGESQAAGRSKSAVGKALALEQMGLASPRPELGKIGRVHVLMHEVSEPAENLLQQDIKGYPKMRYPLWDFEKPGPRKPLMEKDERQPPGKYDAKWESIAPLPRSGIPFDRAMSRNVPVQNLGYSAPPAVLHPDEKRSPGGCVADRSTAKDLVRRRITNVNDFPKELPRPSIERSLTFHVESDASACEAVLWRDLTFDADLADRSVTSRRDVAPTYRRMMPRGREAVQGVRALQSDLGVRGSVGLGFVETSGQREQSIEMLESRAADGVRERPNIGPKFDQSTLFDPLLVKNNYNHGYAPVHGAGRLYDAKRSPLRKPHIAGGSFERKAERGFTGHTGHGGPWVLRQSRTYEALPSWSPDKLSS